MRKVVKKMTTFLLVMVFLSSGFWGLVGCGRNPRFYSAYFEFELNERDGYAIVRRLTELGREQEILAIPMYVEGLPVRQIGYYPRLNLLGMSGGIESSNLTKLYVPYTVEHIVKDGILISNYEIKNGAVIPKYVVIDLRVISPENLINGNNNVFFKYNFSNASNHGYFWMDYINGSNLYLMPPPPTRQGYIFSGWYHESQGINRWDNQMPKSVYENLRLYARWRRY